MVLVDSSVWIDYFNGKSTVECDALDALLATEPVLIADLILTEVLQGFRSDAGYRQARTLLDPLTCMSGSLSRETGDQMSLRASLSIDPLSQRSRSSIPVKSSRDSPKAASSSAERRSTCAR